MKNSGQSIRINLDALAGLAKKMTKKEVDYDKLVEKRVRRATQMVWAIAHQKRPLVTRTMADAWNVKVRVSDPNAQAGVPVRTGALQASITQSVHRNKFLNFEGKVETRGIAYAAYMEYGTSRMGARPFMRPAVNLTKQAIKSMFALKVESNL